ncbi:MAG: hypothetical protein JSS81_17110 [Acidobacteria bacterium]|nr:hypothetical protein [Acidobacteriota bacterium]
MATEAKQSTENMPQSGPATGNQTPGGAAPAGNQPASGMPQSAGQSQTAGQPQSGSTGTSSQPQTNRPAGNTGGENQTETLKQTGTEILGQVREKATGLIDEQKTNLTSGLSSVADSLRKVGDELRGDDENKIGQMTAQYGEQLAKGIEKITDYFENADLRDIKRDVEGFARRQPALFIGGAFVLGLLAARFLKTSTPGGSGRRGRARNGRRSEIGSDFTEGVHPV